MLPHAPDNPRAMKGAGVVEARRAMLGLPHIAPLATYSAELRARRLGEVPEFDPLDGGVDATILFLFEKPGPMTTIGSVKKRRGSGFISRDNDDPTADATFDFMRRAGIPRERTAIWNSIPWWNGVRKTTAQELELGLACLDDLICLLSKLKAVMLVGRKAARARQRLENRGITLLESDHPSPIVKARWPRRWEDIPGVWRKLAPFC